MPAPLIGTWMVGAVLFFASIIYFSIDDARTGQLFRKKFPMMVIGRIGGTLAVTCIFIAIATR